MSIQPKLIIHGGAGALEGNIEKINHIRTSLEDICDKTYTHLCSTTSYDAVIYGIKLLEDDPLFNAGTGSKTQHDGQIRMSAALMDGSKTRFSGVINIQNVQNPILIAERLQNYDHTVLSGEMATKFAHELGFKAYNPLTVERLKESKLNKGGATGTVGVVALDSSRKISVGTSTGGIGGEIPGRVSDSSTIAGTYANLFAGVSGTGIGEHIINSGVATKIVTRVEDGYSLKDAVSKSINEGKSKDYHFGAIGISSSGDIIVDKTKDTIYYAFSDGHTISIF